MNGMNGNGGNLLMMIHNVTDTENMCVARGKAYAAMTTKSANNFARFHVEHVDETCGRKYEKRFKRQLLSHSPCKATNVGIILLKGMSIRGDILCKMAHIRKINEG